MDFLLDTDLYSYAQPCQGNNLAQVQLIVHYHVTFYGSVNKLWENF